MRFLSTETHGPPPDYEAERVRIKDRLARRDFSFMGDDVLAKRARLAHAEYVLGAKNTTLEYIGKLRERGVDMRVPLSEGTATLMSVLVSNTAMSSGRKNSKGAWITSLKSKDIDRPFSISALFIPENRRIPEGAVPEKSFVGQLSVFSPEPDGVLSMVTYNLFNQEGGELVVERHVSQFRDGKSVAEISRAPDERSPQQNAEALECLLRIKADNELGLSAVAEGEIKNFLDVMAGRELVLAKV